MGWNTAKIISWLISLRFMLGLTPTWAIWCNMGIPQNWGGIGKLGWNRGGVRSSGAQKPAISPKRSEEDQGYYDG